MEEQIYQSVWCQVFALICAGPNVGNIEEHAAKRADAAAAAAVRRWSAAKQHAAIVAANKEKP